MRFFFIGPRILGIRPGISFGASDLRKVSAPQGTVKFRDLVMSAVVVGSWIWLAYSRIFIG
jgi:hypothetical protein